MGANQYSCRRVLLTDVGEQEEHQQSAAMRCHVQSQRSVVPFEACTGVPTGIAGFIRAGKSNWKCAETRSGKSPSRAGKLIEGGMQPGHVHCLPERFLSVIAQTNDRSRPRGWIVRIAARVAP